MQEVVRYAEERAVALKRLQDQVDALASDNEKLSERHAQDRRAYEAACESATAERKRAERAEAREKELLDKLVMVTNERDELRNAVLKSSIVPAPKVERATHATPDPVWIPGQAPPAIRIVASDAT